MRCGWQGKLGDKLAATKNCILRSARSVKQVGLELARANPGDWRQRSHCEGSTCGHAGQHRQLCELFFLLPCPGAFWQSCASSFFSASRLSLLARIWLASLRQRRFLRRISLIADLARNRSSLE